MGETLDWWLQGGDWYDRKQQRAIDSLASSNARARAETRTLHKQVSQNQASLQKRVDRLERALQAVVELEDVREELNEHVPAALVRRHARSLVMAISGLGGGDSAARILDAPTDVPEYWLAPASEWAASLLTDQPDQSSLETARRRDPVRTDLFVMSLAAVSDRPIDVSEVLDRQLAAPLQVTDWQREMWTAIAAGRFGSGIRGVLIERLRSAADEVTRDRVGLALLGASAPAGPVESARQLASLARALDSHVVEGSDSDTTSDRRATPTGGDESDRENERNDRLAELLAVVVDEGAPGEVEVLDSMLDIRRILAADAAVQFPDRRDVGAVVGEPVALLLADLGGPDPDLRDVAIDVFADEIASLAKDLHSSAETATPPSEVVDVFGHRVEVTGLDVDESAFIEHVHAAHPLEPPPRMSPIGIVGAVMLLVGLLAIPLAVAAGTIVAVVGVAGIGWGWWSFSERRNAAQRSSARRTAAHQRAVTHVQTATRRVAAEASEQAAAMSTIDESLMRVVRRVEMPIAIDAP